MINKTFNLHEFFPKLKAAQKYDFTPTLTAYCTDNSNEIDPNIKRQSIIICPGGGYGMTSDREAEPVALRFIAIGYNTFVLRYSVAPENYPTALLQLSAAVSLIRSKADELNVDTEKIAVLGFSAGSHLTGCLGVYWNEPFIRDTIGIEAGSNQPNAMILCYPVITSGAYAHRGSFDNLIGKNASQDLNNQVSLEKHVNENVPPVFIWHAFEDGCVPVQNSLLFANALKEKSISCEMHIYSQGCHGMSLCDAASGLEDWASNPHCKTWIHLCHEWLDNIFGSTNI